MSPYELFVRKMVGECRAAGIPGEKPHVTLQRFIEREGESAPEGNTPEGNTVQEVWDNFCARSWERQIGLYGAGTSGIKAAAIMLLREENAILLSKVKATVNAASAALAARGE